MTPEEVVEKQLTAYNAHDIDAFMATYSPTIEVLRFPSGDVVFTDVAAFRQEYAAYFKETPPHVKIDKRILRGNFVIDYEIGNDPENGNWEAVAIYEVVDDLIQRVWFVQNNNKK
jgi:hypothetical protein